MFALYVLVTLAVGYVVTQTAGYIIHRSMHKKISGPLYRSHTAHHQFYPPADYLSETYRDVSWKDKPIFYYAIPAALVIATSYWLLPFSLATIFTVELLFLAWLNDWLHMAFHISGHWLERFAWFHRLRDLHWYHHLEDQENFGIFIFNADRIAGTYTADFDPPNYDLQESVSSEVVETRAEPIRLTTEEAPVLVPEVPVQAQ